MYFFEPTKGHGLPHDPMKAIVAPRPIGWISTRAEDGTLNLGPYSFFNLLASNPCLVWFSSEGEKDSVVHARHSGEFCANLVSADLMEKMNVSAIDAPRDVSEFGYAGLTPAESKLISTPHVREAHAVLECRLTEILEPKGLGGRPTGNFVVIGEVVGVHIDEAVMTDGLFDITKAETVARLGYMDYLSVKDVFSRRRPRWADRVK